MDKKEKNLYLNLNKSILSYVVLNDVLLCDPDLDIYKKVIVEYINDIPAFETGRILKLCSDTFAPDDAYDVIQLIFKTM